MKSRGEKRFFCHPRCCRKYTSPKKRRRNKCRIKEISKPIGREQLDMALAQLQMSQDCLWFPNNLDNHGIKNFESFHPDQYQTPSAMDAFRNLPNDQRGKAYNAPQLMRRGLSRLGNLSILDNDSGVVYQRFHLNYISETIIVITYPTDADLEEINDAARLLCNTFEKKYRTNYRVFNLVGFVKELHLAAKVPVIDLFWPKSLAPGLDQLATAVEQFFIWLHHADQYTSLSNENSQSSKVFPPRVAVIHCIGNNNLIVLYLACYLCLCKKSWEKSMIKYFEEQRVIFRFLDEFDSIEITPSQKRYVNYYKDLLNSQLVHNKNLVGIHSLVYCHEKATTNEDLDQEIFSESDIKRIFFSLINQKSYQKEDLKNYSIFAKIYQNLNLIHTSKEIFLNSKMSIDSLIFLLNPVLTACGDILIAYYVKNNLTNVQDVIFRVQFNSSDINADEKSRIFLKSELDKIDRDENIPSNAQLMIHFSNDEHIIRRYEDYFTRNIYSYKPFVLTDNTFGIFDEAHHRNLLENSIVKSFCDSEVKDNGLNSLTEEYPVNDKGFAIEEKVVDNNHLQVSNVSKVPLEFVSLYANDVDMDPRGLRKEANFVNKPHNDKPQAYPSNLSMPYNGSASQLTLSQLQLLHKQLLEQHQLLLTKQQNKQLPKASLHTQKETQNHLSNLSNETAYVEGPENGNLYALVQRQNLQLSILQQQAKLAESLSVIPNNNNKSPRSCHQPAMLQQIGPQLSLDSSSHINNFINTEENRNSVRMITSELQTLHRKLRQARQDQEQDPTKTLKEEQQRRLHLHKTRMMLTEQEKRLFDELRRLRVSSREDSNESEKMALNLKIPDDERQMASLRRKPKPYLGDMRNNENFRKQTVSIEEYDDQECTPRDYRQRYHSESAIHNESITDPAYLIDRTKPFHNVWDNWEASKEDKTRDSHHKIPIAPNINDHLLNTHGVGREFIPSPRFSPMDGGSRRMIPSPNLNPMRAQQVNSVRSMRNLSHLNAGSKVFANPTGGNVPSGSLSDTGAMHRKNRPKSSATVQHGPAQFNQNQFKSIRGPNSLKRQTFANATKSIRNLSNTANNSDRDEFSFGYNDSDRRFKQGPIQRSSNFHQYEQPPLPIEFIPVSQVDELSKATLIRLASTVNMWYQPHITRNQAIEYLMNRDPGTFLVRNSGSFMNALGLALRVDKNCALQLHGAEISEPRSRIDLVRHYLIEVLNSSTSDSTVVLRKMKVIGMSPSEFPPQYHHNQKGHNGILSVISGLVRLRGCINEPVFSNLVSLLYEHSVQPLALPMCIRLPIDHDTKLPSLIESSNVLKEMDRAHATPHPRPPPPIQMRNQNQRCPNFPNRGSASDPMPPKVTARRSVYHNETPLQPNLIDFGSGHRSSDLHLSGQMRRPMPTKRHALPYQSHSLEHPIHPGGETQAEVKSLYLGSIDMEFLNGPNGIAKAVDVLLENSTQVKQTETVIDISPNGLTVTDTWRKLFFRRQYPSLYVLYVGIDPEERCWHSPETRSFGSENPRIFGFIAKKHQYNENMCHLFCELPDFPATRVIELFDSILSS